jgi:hypothetical protein
VSRSCPWCLEPLRWRERRAERCPHCDRPLAAADAELRPIDVRYPQVEAVQQAHFRQVLGWGAGVVAVVALAVPAIHLVAVVAVPLVLVAHMVVLRVYLIREARRLLGPTRRMFTRWMCRFSFLWLGLPGYGLMVVPVAGVVAGVVTFAALTGLGHRYTLWSLRQERDRAPLQLWEKLLLAAFAVLTVVLLLVVTVGALLLGWGVAALVELCRDLAAGL